MKLNIFVTFEQTISLLLKMKSRVYTSLFLVLITTICVAQKNFTKAKIITTERDTLSGYINYKEWIKSPGQITFKEDLSQPSVVNYDTKQILGFIIDSNQETYHSLNFKVEKLPRSSNKIMYSSMKEYNNRAKITDSISTFARVLTAGKATLYHYVDKNAEAHFLIKKDDSLHVLIYHIIETKRYSANFREYRSQMAEILVDACKPLPIYATDYYVSSMKKLISTYNACFNEPIKTESVEKDKGRWEYGIMAGAGYTKLTHSMGTSFSYVSVKGDATITPVGGVFLNYVFARGRGRFALMNELHTYHVKSSIFFDGEHFNFDMHYLGLQHLFRYTVYVGKPSVYALLGFSYSRVIKQNSTMVRRDGSIEPLVMFSWSVKNDEQRGIAGIGLSLKKLMLEGRYYRGNGFAGGLSTAIPNNRFDILLKFNFGRISKNNS